MCGLGNVYEVGGIVSAPGEPEAALVRRQVDAQGVVVRVVVELD